MTNKVVKKIGNKKVGFFLCTKSKAEFREYTGHSITDIFDQKNNSDLLFAAFLMACANAYEAFHGDKTVYDIDQAYLWMDQVETDGWVEFIQELFKTPKLKEAEEAKV